MFNNDGTRDGFHRWRGTGRAEPGLRFRRQKAWFLPAASVRGTCGALGARSPGPFTLNGRRGMGHAYKSLAGAASAEVHDILPRLHAVGIGFFFREVLTILGLILGVFRWLITRGRRLVDAPRLNCLVVPVLGVFALLLADFGEVLLHGLGSVVLRRRSSLGCAKGRATGGIGAAARGLRRRLDDLRSRNPLIAVVHTAVVIDPAENISMRNRNGAHA